MSKWKIYTPEGVQDILFEECYTKREMEEAIRRLFRSCGYYEIETPTIEFYDTFSAEENLTPQETMFKFFDKQGRILVMRPEATIPVARVAATKLKDASYPLRFSYLGNMFRYNELGGGKYNEFTQAGVEILGISSTEADAEVISTAIQAVKAAGMQNFQIDIGQVEFFKGLMEESRLSEQDAEQIRILIDRKDYIGIEELVKKHDMNSGLKELILELPRLFGSNDVLDRVAKITSNPRSLNALENLRQVLDILEDAGLGNYVSVDLGMVQSHNYYTGIIFRGFTYGVGFPILSGGRYDKLVEKFGKKCAATGFSIGINMIMTALERQKAVFAVPKSDTLVCYGKSGRKSAFEIAGELRRQGLNVEMDLGFDNMQAARAYAGSKGIGGIVHVLDAGRIELYNLENGEVTQVTVSELLKNMT